MKIEEILDVVDTLLSMGLTNMEINVICQDSPNMSLKEFFGITSSTGYVMRGIYVYENDQFNDSLLKSKFDCFVAECGLIYFLSI